MYLSAVSDGRVESLIVAIRIMVNESTFIRQHVTNTFTRNAPQDGVLTVALSKAAGKKAQAIPIQASAK
jgi:hypothetical protein